MRRGALTDRRKPALLRSFAPVAGANARVLILGSMPGAESLRAGQYYAHPRNAFWTIMGELAGAAPALPYAQRIRRLRAAGIALWDVLAACVREGSLDAAIDERSIIANDLVGFLARHPSIRLIAFNGAMAERCFRRHVAAGIDIGRYRFVRLPSTSPAHAARNTAEKLRLWRAALRLQNKPPKTDS